MLHFGVPSHRGAPISSDSVMGLVRIEPRADFRQLDIILQIPFLLTDGLKSKEKWAICLFYHHVFLILKHLSAFSGEAVVLLGFSKMFYCLSLNESWYWNFLVNSILDKLRIWSSALFARGGTREAREGLWFAWERELVWDPLCKQRWWEQWVCAARSM